MRTVLTVLLLASAVGACTRHDAIAPSLASQPAAQVLSPRSTAATAAEMERASRFLVQMQREMRQALVDADAKAVVGEPLSVTYARRREYQQAAVARLNAQLRAEGKAAIKVF